MTKLYISKTAEKQLKKLPPHIREAFTYWVGAVQAEGIRQVRRLPGYHDEPLFGVRQGQRSVRLNKAYRVFYVETLEGLEILVIEVNKHEY